MFDKLKKQLIKKKLHINIEIKLIAKFPNKNETGKKQNNNKVNLFIKLVFFKYINKIGCGGRI